MSGPESEWSDASDGDRSVLAVVNALRQVRTCPHRSPPAYGCPDCLARCGRLGRPDQVSLSFCLHCVGRD